MARAFRKNCPSYITWPAPAFYSLSSPLPYWEGLDRFPPNISKFIPR